MSRISDPSLTWKDGDLPFSQGFDDIYFKADGLDETRLVFLEGNNLPQAWQNQKQFTIGETGFGTGLNFLSAWKMFEETATPDQRLDFISVEKFPLSIADLQRATHRLRDTIGDQRINRFLEIYPMRIPGFHRRHVTDRVTLTLIFDDALRAFKQLDCSVDAWFLDGFNPAKNQELWHSDLFKEMARLSHSQTTLSSFTAVAEIRRQLADAGFAIERAKGYGYKKHRIIGRFQTDKEKPSFIPQKKITIAGAGLAGAGAAYALKRRGIDVEIFEKENDLGLGASGNQLGLINPKIEAQDNPKTDAGLAAFSFATHILKDLKDIDYKKSGALHLAFDADKTERLKKLYQNGSWLTPHMQWIDIEQTKKLCGIELRYNGLFYADAASVHTKKLVAKLLESIPVRFGQTIENPDLWANGWGLHETFPQLPLQSVRGQVTYIQAPQELKCPVMFGSYAAETSNGLWSVGATFDQNVTDKETNASDDVRNLENLKNILNIEATPVSSWAQIRTASRDRFPIVGKIGNTHVIGALGSHGIQFGLLLGEIVACILTNAPLPIGRDALRCLSVQRFEKNQ